MNSKLNIFIISAIFIVPLVGCGKDESHTPSEAPKQAITNRIHLPPEIVSNLGVTFEKVKRGKVGVWLTVPGSLETPEEQSYVLNAPSVGRLRLVKSLWDDVEKGEPIAEVTSPDLVALQEELVAATSIQSYAQEEGRDTVLPGAKTRAAQATRTVTRRLKTLSVLTGLPEEVLMQPAQNGQPKWMTLSTLTISAPSSGSIVELHGANGELVQSGNPIAKIIDTSTLVFQGRVAEAELTRLSPTMPASIFLEGFKEGVATTARLLPTTDKEARLLLLEAHFPNKDLKIPDGLTAKARLLLREGASEEAIVHPECIVLDGLEHIVFRRDPEKPEYVIRTPVELGTTSDEEVEILSGVMEGDEVVRDGVQQLKQTGLGKAPAGGHFHADGTWHEGDK